jgi:hypothetical protein
MPSPSITESDLSTADACASFYRLRGRVTEDEMATMVQSLAMQPNGMHEIETLTKISNEEKWIVIENYPE